MYSSTIVLQALLLSCWFPNASCKRLVSVQNAEPDKKHPPDFGHNPSTNGSSGMPGVESRSSSEIPQHHQQLQVPSGTEEMNLTAGIQETPKALAQKEVDEHTSVIQETQQEALAQTDNDEYASAAQPKPKSPAATPPLLFPPMLERVASLEKRVAAIEATMGGQPSTKKVSQELPQTVLPNLPAKMGQETPQETSAPAQVEDTFMGLAKPFPWNEADPPICRLFDCRETVDCGCIMCGEIPCVSGSGIFKPKAKLTRKECAQNTRYSVDHNSLTLVHEPYKFLEIMLKDTKSIYGQAADDANGNYGGTYIAYGTCGKDGHVDDCACYGEFQS
eukprot:gnl/MRDRNA2_/MRDRNA2_31240_c0_seq1.p1 gnl/MRDRNA2_/MRDRNA2_31240_c0~~gnl/MRDRNA2_/MRDRNA2_31240_c0_seq1.p1  ORF type:complete len:333 (+),score=58.10 gnl/MRDRNA2_/MRDRNA2_31240_c0_seq1:86-1084(+)